MTVRHRRGGDPLPVEVHWFPNTTSGSISAVPEMHAKPPTRE